MSTAFHCQNCGSVTDVSSMLRAFEDNPHCPTCGMSASESDTKMQDDLANLMARNLHLGTMHAPSHNLSTPPTPQVAPHPTPITYISQHYHHSSHMASQPSSDDDLPASTILQNAGVDPNALLPCQLQLFKNADAEQKQRLIELWKIAPPTYGDQLPTGTTGNWPQTSMEQEVAAARERWHKHEQDKWKNLSVLPRPRSVEPYMMDGYRSHQANGEHVRQRANEEGDASREWWKLTDQEPMEHQYGMLQMHMEGYYNSAQHVDTMMD